MNEFWFNLYAELNRAIFKHLKYFSPTPPPDSALIFSVVL